MSSSLDRIWWSLTGNYGNILPLDWNTSQSRELHLKALNLSLDDVRETSLSPDSRLDNHLSRRMNRLKMTRDDDSDSLDEEELAKDLDLHSLILNSKIHPEPIFTAEQVLEEIDEILTMHDHHEGTGGGIRRHKIHHEYDDEEDQPSKSLGVGSSVCTSTDISPSGEADALSSLPDNSHCGQPYSSTSAFSSLMTSSGQPSLSSLMFEGKWRDLSTAQLNEVLIEQERMIQFYSETLIQELASRDELEFEKEVKNNFISLLLSIQNKRRQSSLDRKKVKSSGASSLMKMPSSSSMDSMKYLTTVIPYDPESGPPDIRSLQVLMKSEYQNILSFILLSA